MIASAPANGFQLIKEFVVTVANTAASFSGLSLVRDKFYFVQIEYPPHTAISNMVLSPNGNGNCYGTRINTVGSSIVAASVVDFARILQCSTGYASTAELFVSQTSDGYVVIRGKCCKDVNWNSPVLQDYVYNSALPMGDLNTLIFYEPLIAGFPAGAVFRIFKGTR